MSDDFVTKEEYNSLLNKIKVLESRIYHPLPFVIEDVATTESIFTILIEKGITTSREIGKYMNLYGTAIDVILAIMYDKKIATPEDVGLYIIAFHHVLRMKLTDPDMTTEKAVQERVDFVGEIKKSKTPLKLMGQ